LIFASAVQVAITTVPTPPPVFVPNAAADHASPARRVPSRARYDVVVRGGDTLLWRGTLWIGGRGPSSWRQTLQEAQDDGCGPSSWPGAQTETSIQVVPAPPYGGDTGQATVTARWSRPSGVPCGGARVVEIRQTISLDAASPIVLSGDGGLVVELRRQRP